MLAAVGVPLVVSQLSKSVCSVQKNPNTNKAEINSVTYAVSSLTGDTPPLFPNSSPHNFCYVSVHPLKRHVVVWYHAFHPIY